MWMRACILGLALLLELPCGATTHDGETYGWSSVTAIPTNEYELKFLGVIVDKNARDQKGLFLFIWKGDRTIHLDGYGFDKKERFTPREEFSIHRPTGRWEGLECHWEGGYPPQYYAFPPGKVSVLLVRMEWLTSGLSPHSLEGADKARLYVMTKEGALFSREFPLPLTVNE